MDLLDGQGDPNRMTTDQDTALLALLEYLNRCEEGAAAAKQVILRAKIGEENQKSNNDQKIDWQQAEGRSGTYERSEDIDSPGHKALLKDLAAHQGKLTRDGYFYWTFRDDSTIGRKRLET